ncbi:MAG: hypothetical protein AAFN80_13105 [Pseudomonadota bacterium]
MSLYAETSTYPGSRAEVCELLNLAGAYYAAAANLLRNAEKKAPLSYAPARLCSIHSIELYLNAFLRHQGTSPEEIRGRRHNLADPGFVATLKLRKKTAIHLTTMTERREYLISRYAPELASQHTELNRLTATLDEVMNKTTYHIRSR